MAQPAQRQDLESVVDPPVDIAAYLPAQRARLRPRSFWQVDRNTLVWAAVAMVLGAMITAQLRSQPVTAPLDTDYPRRVSAETITRLEDEQAYLKLQIGDLRRQITQQQEQAVKDKHFFAEMSAVLRTEQAMAGLIPFVGPGVTVKLDDSTIRTLPPGDDASSYLVHEYDLRDVINLLWLSGAEAISVNGERVVAPTSIYCVGTTILVNSTRLSAPYWIVAIGDPQQLAKALNAQNSLVDIKSRAQRYGLQFKVEQQSQVEIPAFDGTLHARYAELGAKN